VDTHALSALGPVDLDTASLPRSESSNHADCGGVEIVDEGRKVMRVLGTKAFLVPIVALLIGAVLATVAYAAVVSRQVFAEGSNLQYRFERQTADSGGFDSGWHMHPGVVIFQVESGSVQIFQGSCTPRTLGPGDTYIEVPWKPVRAMSTGAVVWTTSLFIAAGQPLLVPLAAYSPQQPNPCP
jgi:hypothetical protein